MRSIALCLLLVGCDDDGRDPGNDFDDRMRLGDWGPVDDLQIVAVHAHLLPTGEVFYWDRDAINQDIEWGPPRTWDPRTRAITTIEPKLEYEPFCSGHTFLPDGGLFVAGGHIDTAVGEDRASVFDPIAKRWTTVPQRMSAGRWYPSTTSLTAGDVLVLSGSSRVDSDGYVFEDLPQIYMASRGVWRDLPGARFSEGGGLDPRTIWWYPYMHLAPDGRAFLAGPGQQTGYLDTAGDGEWSMVPGAARPFAAQSSEIFRDYGSSVMYDAGKIMIVGGSPSPSTLPDELPTASAEIIDLTADAPSWADADAMKYPRRMHTATVLADGTVLVTGGTSGAGFNDALGAVMEPELWDPETNRWRVLRPMSVRRIYHSVALLLPDARVLVAGGGLPFGGGEIIDHPDSQVFDPPYLFRGPRPEVDAAPDEIAYATTFTVTTPDAARIRKVTLIRLGSVTHGYNFNQRAIELDFTSGRGALEITVPANRNLAPPGHYMLFLIDDNGVPSVAPIVRLVTQMCDVTVIVRGVNVTPGQQVVLTGELPELGEFNPRFGVELSGAGTTWTGTVQVPQGTAFEYKAAIVDVTAGEVQLEAGANRSATACPATIDVEWRP